VSGMKVLAHNLRKLVVLTLDSVLSPLGRITLIYKDS
jgi:hypothetical protein